MTEKFYTFSLNDDCTSAIHECPEFFSSIEECKKGMEYLITNDDEEVYIFEITISLDSVGKLTRSWEKIGEKNE